MTSAITKLYANEVIAGRRTIEEVPSKYREDVRSFLGEEIKDEDVNDAE
ncbi:CD1375 family protein [Paenilisteria newyorkensis]|nr:CD1375 family protein [Listeria newyorkensis]KMT58889.1 hypothetical protein X559_2895 [Listeria newyorkensis]